MQFLLTEEEFIEAKETLRPQLTDQTTLATAKAIVLDSFWDAIGSLPADLRSETIEYHEQLLKERWQRLPPGPVREYFEQSPGAPWYGRP